MPERLFRHWVRRKHESSIDYCRAAQFKWRDAFEAPASDPNNCELDVFKSNCNAEPTWSVFKTASQNIFETHQKNNLN